MWLIFLTLFIPGSLASTDIKDRNKFIIYTLLTSETYNLSEAENLLQSSLFDNSKKTVLYVHGYIANQQEESVQDIVAAYNSRDDYNLITLDWAKDAFGEYYSIVVPNTLKLATVVAEILLRMIKLGLNLQRLHLLGHSLGAHMVGIIGREMKERSSNTVVLKRITALDPARPAFYGSSLKPVGANDAEFVDVIHTDTLLFGATVSTGTVDFWPNGRQFFQPGCISRDTHSLSEVWCSHWRSGSLWAESVQNQNPNKFNAVKASNWIFFNLGFHGPYDSNVLMGNDCPLTLTGDYYLETNGASPFARGLGST